MKNLMGLHFEVTVKCPKCDREWTFYCEDESEIPLDGFLECGPCVYNEYKETKPPIDANQIDMYPGSD